MDSVTEFVYIAKGLAFDVDELRLFLQIAAASCAASFSLLLVWRAVGARMLRKVKRPPAVMQSFENSFVALFVSVVAPAFAIGALCELPMSPVAAPTQAAIVALGISMGYIVFDLVWLLLHPELGTPTILAHHVLSLVGFPYATLRHLCVPFVQFFILTEATGLLQHACMLLLKLDREGTPLYFIVGVSWTVSFFLVRIMPSPWLIYELVWKDSSRHLWASAFTPFDFWFGVCTLPLPFLLNAYWGYLLAAGALKVLRKGRRDAPLPSGGPTSATPHGSRMLI